MINLINLNPFYINKGAIKINNINNNNQMGNHELKSKSIFKFF